MIKLRYTGDLSENVTVKKKRHHGNEWTWREKEKFTSFQGIYT